MDMTAGESLRFVMKREKIKQTDLARNLETSKQNVSKTLRNFDENKGSLSSLVEYAKSIGLKVEFNFVKIEE